MVDKRHQWRFQHRCCTVMKCGVISYLQLGEKQLKDRAEAMHSLDTPLVSLVGAFNAPESQAAGSYHPQGMHTRRGQKDEDHIWRAFEVDAGSSAKHW